MKAIQSVFRRRQFLKISVASVGALGFLTIIPARLLGAQSPGSLIRIAQIRSSISNSAAR